MSNRQNNYNISASTSSYVSSNFNTTQSSSSSSSGSGTTRRFTETMTSNDRDGTSIRRTQEESGRPTVQEETYIPPRNGHGHGHGRISDTTTTNTTGLGPGSALEYGQDTGGRVEDVTDDPEQAEKDRLYEERIEDEYAKREGGA